MDFLLPAGLVAVIIIVIAWFYYFSTDAKIRRKLKRAPVVPIKDLRPDSEARIVGRVQSGPSLRGPLSDRACVYYRATVEEHRSSGKNSHWVKIVDEIQYCDFSVEDATGQVLIRMVNPKVALIKDSHSRSGMFDDASQVEEAFLQRHSSGSVGLLGMNRSLRYIEGALEIGETVTVFGKVVDLSGGVMILEELPEGTLYLSDDPNTLI